MAFSATGARGWFGLVLLIGAVVMVVFTAKRWRKLNRSSSIAEAVLCVSATATALFFLCDGTLARLLHPLAMLGVPFSLWIERRCAADDRHRGVPGKGGW